MITEIDRNGKMNEGRPRRVLTYAGKAGDLVPALRAWTPNPRLPTPPETYLLPLGRDELAVLYGLLANEDGHGDLSDDGPDRRLWERVQALALTASLTDEPVTPEAVPL